MPTEKHLHIVSFDIPYPPNYGGVIDVFYKIKYLAQRGVKIQLHCFEYRTDRASELEQYCEKIYYYKRETSFVKQLSLLPYNVISRKSEKLISNLLLDDYPILFETLSTCYYIDDERLKTRKKYYRESNIEHHYYAGLGKATNSWAKKIYFFIEAFRFKIYQKTLKHATAIFVVAKHDKEYLEQHLPVTPVFYIPSFQSNNEVTTQQGMSDYILYHGNLMVSENEIAAKYLIENVFSKLNARCVIMGLNPSEQLQKTIERYPNVDLIANPSDSEVYNYIQNAQINTLVTFQSTGLKLKLLNALYIGRHAVVNSAMLEGTGLDELCMIANTPEKQIAACEKLLQQPFSTEEIKQREKLLEKLYSPYKQADILINKIFNND